MIIEGKNLEDINLKFNLQNLRSLTLNNMGEDINSKVISGLSKNLIESIFNNSIIGETSLVENENKYFLIEILNLYEFRK